jgi:putative FmdB family regulatory protein
MPTYDYQCPQCGPFDTLRSIAMRDQAAACPECSGMSPRVLSGSPALALMENGTRRAVSINERASHEPTRSGDYARLKHPAGCGCCGTGKRGATVQAPNGNKAFPSKRPWMISH